jgi:ethanolamine phosphate phosphodiesterase
MAYYSTVYPPRSTRDHFIEPPSVLERFFAGLPPGLALLLQRIPEGAKHICRNSDAFRIPRTWQEANQKFNPRELLNVPNGFIVIWIILLLWGERWAFEGSIKACQWPNWERWVCLKLCPKTCADAEAKPF